MRKHLRVYGRVQGVGYRVYVKTMARQMGLRGKVRNLDDGSVEIIVEVPNEEILQRFLSVINLKGEDSLFEPKVLEIKIEEYEGKEELPLFDIDYGHEMSIAEKEMIERSEIGILAFNWMGKYLSGKIDNLGEKIDNVSDKIDKVSDKIDNLGEKIDNVSEKMDKGFAEVKEEIRGVKIEVQGTNERLDRIANKLDENLQKTDIIIEKTDAFHSEMVEKFEYLDVKYGEFSKTLNTLVEKMENMERDIREMKDAFIKLVNHLLEKKE